MASRGLWKPLGSSYPQKLWRSTRKIAGAKLLYTLQLGMLLFLHSDICMGEEENGRSWKKRGCATYTGVCLGWSCVSLGQSAKYLCRVNVGTLLPMLRILSPALSWTDNVLQHRHQLSHLSNKLTVERENWKAPFHPCLLSCKVSRCSYSRQMGICWHKCSSKADRPQALYQPSP